ncbi:MAG: right-handed parallel beta-helix repeat-containing protein [Candidatus Paceibacterota bacterium]
MRKLLCILFFLLMIPSVSWSANHYFDATDGNDSTGDGSSGSPWQTLAKANTECTSGDVCYFASEETWTGSSSMISCASGVTYDGSTWGTGTRATLQASTDSSGWSMVDIYQSNVVFQGFKVDGNNHNISQIRAGLYYTISDITIDNCEVTNNRTTDSGSQFYYGIHLGPRDSHTVSNVTIKNCHVHHTGHEGITIYHYWQDNIPNRNYNITVRGNTVHDTGQVSGTNRGNGIDCFNNADNITLEYNTIYNIIGNFSAFAVGTYGLPTYSGYYGSPENVVFRYNIIYASPNAIGIPAAYNNPIDSVYIYGNIIIGGMVSLTSGNYVGANIGIYNNTMLQGGYSPTHLFRTLVTASTGTIDFKNNILNSTSTILVGEDSTNSFSHINHSNNLYYRSSSATDTHVESGGVNYHRNGGVNDFTTSLETSAKKTNPAFTGGTIPTGFSGTYGTDMIPNTTYFAISSGDAINNGYTLGSPYNGCINGAGLATVITRPQGAGYDIGAYEYGSTPPTAQGCIMNGTTFK